MKISLKTISSIQLQFNYKPEKITTLFKGRQQNPDAQQSKIGSIQYTTKNYYNSRMQEMVADNWEKNEAEKQRHGI